MNVMGKINPKDVGFQITIFKMLLKAIKYQNKIDFNKLVFYKTENKNCFYVELLENTNIRFKVHDDPQNYYSYLDVYYFNNNEDFANNIADSKFGWFISCDEEARLAAYKRKTKDDFLQKHGISDHSSNFKWFGEILL